MCLVEFDFHFKTIKSIKKKRTNNKDKDVDKLGVLLSPMSDPLRPTVQEQDHLQRSKKKVRKEDAQFNRSSSNVAREEDWTVDENPMRLKRSQSDPMWKLLKRVG